MEIYKIAWKAGGRKFEFAQEEVGATLVSPDGQIMQLSRAEWIALAKAIEATLGNGYADEARSLKNKSAPNAGERWTPEDEAELLRLWQDEKKTIADLAQKFGRNPGGVAARLVHLGAANSRDEIQSEDHKRNFEVKDTPDDS